MVAHKQATYFAFAASRPLLFSARLSENGRLSEIGRRCGCGTKLQFISQNFI